MYRKGTFILALCWDRQNPVSPHSCLCFSPRTAGRSKWQFSPWRPAFPPLQRLLSSQRIKVTLCKKQDTHNILKQV